jgi:hypothetical protein
MPQARQMAAHQSCREQQHQADQTQRQEAARAAADYDAKRQQLEQIWRSMSPVDQAAMEGKVRTEFAHHTPEKVHQLCLELLSDCSGKGAT